MAVLTFAVAVARAEDHWTEIRSPHFTVITDGHLDQADKVAEQFEQVRFLMQTRFPNFVLDRSEPTLIFAVRDDVSAGLGRSWWPKGPYGYFLGDWEGHWGVVRLDKLDSATWVQVQDEYVRSILEDNLHSLPTWLEDGLSQFYGNSQVGKQQIVLGAPAGDWEMLTTARYLPCSKLFSPQVAKVYDPYAVEVFRVESWALVHYLSFGSGMQGGRLLMEYMRRIEAGNDAIASFQAVFGDIGTFEQGFRSYLQAKTLPAGGLPRLPESDPANVKERAILPAEAAFDQGIMNVSMNNVAHGRKLVEKAIALDPNLAEAHEEAGFLAYDVGEAKQASAEWRKALALNPKLYRALFAETVTGVPFREQTTEQRAATFKNLQEVVHLNPRYAPGFAKMALLLWWQGDLNNAYQAALSAEHLEPWRKYDQIRGHLLLAQKKHAEAAEFARRSATDSEDTDRNDAVALWDQIPPAQRGTGPTLTYGFDARTEVAVGRITRISCSPDGQITQLGFLPVPGGSGTAAPLTFQPHEWVRTGWADSLWAGGLNFSARSFCGGNAVNRPARLVYQPGKTGPVRLIRVGMLEDMPDMPDMRDSTELHKTSAGAVDGFVTEK